MSERNSIPIWLLVVWTLSGLMTGLFVGGRLGEHRQKKWDAEACAAHPVVREVPDFLQADEKNCLSKGGEWVTRNREQFFSRNCELPAPPAPKPQKGSKRPAKPELAMDTSLFQFCETKDEGYYVAPLPSGALVHCDKYGVAWTVQMEMEKKRHKDETELWGCPPCKPAQPLPEKEPAPR